VRENGVVSTDDATNIQESLIEAKSATTSQSGSWAHGKASDSMNTDIWKARAAIRSKMKRTGAAHSNESCCQIPKEGL